MHLARTGAVAAGISLAALTAPAHAETVLRVAMTAADIPQTTGQPNQGAEGTRFIGYTIYDGLINWDMSKKDEAAKLTPGLALEWSADPAQPKNWTFKLRPEVKFHDGSAWNADAAIWNFEKLRNDKAPQYDRNQAAQAPEFITAVERYRKIDNLTIEITTKTVDATFPYFANRVFFSSPARFEESGRDWTRFAMKPSGTGPWAMTGYVPRERADLLRNAAYWDAKRIPKTDRLVLLPIPDASTRTAALLAGRIDWVEAPSPDAVPKLKAAGMQIVTNIYPHIWPYQISFLPDSPFTDLRVRKAANLAIDRDGLVKLLGGTALPAKGQVDPTHPWFGKPAFDIKYDPDQAKKLLAEAGFGPAKPVKVRFAISTAGSGQMQPLPMNEYVQETMRSIGFDVEFVTLEWEALRTRRRVGAMSPENAGIHGVNNSWPYWDPFIGLLGPALSTNTPPTGNNWGAYKNPEVDALGAKVRTTFDPAAQDALLAQLHARIVDDSMWIWVVHDLNPRALSPKVSGFVQAQSWYQDLTPIVMKP